MGPLIPALIGLGGSLFGSLLGRGSANKANSLQQQQLDLQKQFMNRSKPAFDQAYGYYSGLLSGDPARVMQVIGPEADMTALQFEGAKKNLIDSSYARGGGLTRGLANLEAGKAFSISQLLGQVRPMAAQNLSSLASGDAARGMDALAGAQYNAAQQAQLRQNSLIGIGSFLTRLLTTPGLFGSGGGQSPTQAPSQAPPATFGSSNSTWANNTGNGDPFWRQ